MKAEVVVKEEDMVVAAIGRGRSAGIRNYQANQGNNTDEVEDVEGRQSHIPLSPVLYRLC